MKASTVINSYKNGQRDFSGEKLRGRNFAGQDLSGANFSHCDIRGANFKRANLTTANFTGATAGLQKRWMIGLLLILLLLISLFSICLIFVTLIVILEFSGSEITNQVAEWIYLTGLLVFGIITYRKGVREGLIILAMAITLVIGLFIPIILRNSLLTTILVFIVFTSRNIIESIDPGNDAIVTRMEFTSGTGVEIGAGVLAVVLAIVIVAILIIIFCLALMVANVISVVSGVITTIVLNLVGIAVLTLSFIFLSKYHLRELATIQIVTTALNIVLNFPRLLVLVIACFIGLVIFGYYIGYRAIKGDPRDAWIRNFAVAFAATGGTTFKNADLTDANFTKARLKSTDFRDAILIRTCFKNTEKLDHIRPGKTILSQPDVRELLITGYGYKKNYKDADLRGANLDGANLNQANLKQCDLSEASLRATNLEWANLTEVSALKTNFTRCNLTGACLEAWNIDKTTIFKNVDCQYVFLLEEPDQNGNRERRPHDPDKVFQPGDFEQLYSKIMNTVQLLLRNGVNSEAFKIAFQKIMAENPKITYNSIQGAEKKGKDVVVTVEVPKNADKGKIEHQFDETYELRLKLVEKTALLKAEKEHKEEIKEINQKTNNNLTEIAKLALTNQSNSTTIIENKPMTNSPDNSQNIRSGRDVNLTNSNANLREISGKINNLIQQLPEQKDDEKTSIKELLSQLKTLIETDENLNDENKQDALEDVENIAKAANKPEDSNLKKLARRSKNALIGIISNLPNATKLVQECNKLLPAIAELLGLT